MLEGRHSYRGIVTEIRGELKELEEIPSIPRATLYDMIREAKYDKDKWLMGSFVLMANRCSEALVLTRDDIHMEVAVDVLDFELDELAGRLNRLRTEVDVGERLGRDVSNAKKELGEMFDNYQNISQLKDDFHDPSKSVVAADEIALEYPQTLVYVVKLLTLKRKKKIPRYIPILTTDPLGPLFVKAYRNMGDRLFTITRQRVWQIFTDAGIYAFYQDQDYPVPKNPLRHLMLTEASNFFNEKQLYRYAGWKIKGTPDKYVHTRWDDFVIPLLKVARRAPPFDSE